MEQDLAGLLGGQEHRLDPRIGLVWPFVAAGIPLVLAAAAAVALAAGGTGGTVVAVSIAAGVVVATLAAVWARLSWSRWRWSAWPDALELRHGVIVARTSLVPYHRIQQIDVDRDPVERMLGLSSLLLRTASATSDAKIPGIPAPIADALRVRLLTLAGVDDAV